MGSINIYIYITGVSSMEYKRIYSMKYWNILRIILRSARFYTME